MKASVMQYTILNEHCATSNTTTIRGATQKFGEFKQGTRTSCRMPFCH